VSESKGRPTPKRNEANRRRTGPVAPPPTNRKEAAKRLREQQAAGRARVRTGTRAGDERAMLPRDSGPVRRRVRDIVDSRRNLGVLLLPIALLLVLSQLSGNHQAQSLSFALWVATVVAVALDLVGTGLRIRRDLRASFPDAGRLGGHIGYGLLRTTVIRRFRQPPPAVPRGTAF